jgi:hypothetical protein
MKIKGIKYSIRRLKVQGAKFKIQCGKLRFKAKEFILKPFNFDFSTLNIQL